MPETITTETTGSTTTKKYSANYGADGSATARPPLQNNILCTRKSMKFFYPKTDNVNLVIKTVLCNDPDSQRAIADYSVYVTTCADLSATVDQRPVVYVNAPGFYFNVTKSLVVENVVFDGINQFAAMKLTQAVAADGTKTPSDADFHPEPAFSVPWMPKRLCALKPAAG